MQIVTAFSTPLSVAPVGESRHGVKICRSRFGPRPQNLQSARPTVTFAVPRDATASAPAATTLTRTPVSPSSESGKLLTASKMSVKETSTPVTIAPPSSNSSHPLPRFQWSSQSSSSQKSPIRKVQSPCELHSVLQGKASVCSNKDNVTVVKCSASYCSGCRGVAPKYRKIAAAYSTHTADTKAETNFNLHDDVQNTINCETAADPEAVSCPVTFCEMDYVANEDFCRQALGAHSLPFFAVFRGSTLLSAEPIGWRSVSRRLVENIEAAIAQPVAKINFNT